MQPAASAAPAATPVPATNSARPIGRRELDADQQVRQVLSRLTFGARPGDVERVAAIGVDRWIEQQLHPASIADPTLDAVMENVPRWNAPPRALCDSFPPQDVYLRTLRRQRGMPDNAPLDMTPDEMTAYRLLTARGTGIANQLAAAKLMRAELSERQLLEVMTDFWENHFSVSRDKMPTRFSLFEWDRDVIRPHALGKFRDLLGAVAHSPAMLWYLDNYQSMTDSFHLSLPEYRVIHNGGQRPLARRRTGYNENYARELLELHTLGVDGGYTQHDVVEVARALTGWSLDVPREGGGFIFREPQHDAEEKVVLGHTLAAGRGIEDGEDVLDIAARHPSTARFIAFKLARRFVSDSPSSALVARAAETFRRTDGDIAAVVRTIVTSPEFFSHAAYRAKVKSPLELVLSTRRTMHATPDTSQRTLQLVGRLGQPMFGHLTPEGWPETGDAWANAGAMLQRVSFGAQVATNRLPGAPVEQWPSWALVAALPFERQVDAVTHEILGGDVSAETRAILVSARPAPAAADASAVPTRPAAAARDAQVAAGRPAQPPPAGAQVPPVRGMMDAPAQALPPGPFAALRDLIALALGSPEFQRR
jgi:uncharacterized protein (DUF1800 family)